MDNDAVCDAAKEEIIRRYHDTLVAIRKAGDGEEALAKVETIMKKAGIEELRGLRKQHQQCGEAPGVHRLTAALQYQGAEQYKQQDIRTKSRYRSPCHQYIQPHAHDCQRARQVWAQSEESQQKHHDSGE